MIKKKIKITLLGALVFGLGIFIPFLTTEATPIYDGMNCTVQHSSSGHTCTNTTYGYQFEGGGEFINNFKFTYTGYSKSITVTKLEYFAAKVSAGRPYYIDSWISGDGTTKHYPPAASQRFLAVGNKLTFSPNKKMLLNGDNAMLKMNSNLDGAIASVNYEISTLPR